MKLFVGEDGVIRIYIDASSLKSSACLRKFNWTVVQGYVKETIEESYSLSYGNTFHKFLERFYTGVKIEENLEQTKNEYLPIQEKLKYSDYTICTLGHLGATCKAYHKTFYNSDLLEPIKVNDKFLVEQPFAFPIWQRKDGKIEIIVCGTIDLVGKYSKVECFCDHKTTQSYYRENYFDQYRFDVQMMLYSWGLKKILNMDYYLPVVINGVFIKKPTEKSTKLDIWDGARFERSTPIDFSPESIDEFEGWLKRRLGEIIAFFENDETIKKMENFHDMSMCKNFGLCKFFDVCRRPAKVRQEILNSMFSKKYYEPLKFRL